MKDDEMNTPVDKERNPSFRASVGADDDSHPRRSAAPSNKALSQQNEPGRTERYTVLLVDDEKIVQEVAAEMLESLGYNVCCADDGDEAIETFRIRREQVDVVLLDLTMPRMGGRECMKKLREIDPEVNVVFTSGIHVESEKEVLLQEGAKEVIQKPFLLSELANKIGRVVRRST